MPASAATLVCELVEPCVVTGPMWTTEGGRFYAPSPSLAKSPFDTEYPRGRDPADHNITSIAQHAHAYYPLQVINGGSDWQSIRNRLVKRRKLVFPGHDI